MQKQERQLINFNSASLRMGGGGEMRQTPERCWAHL